MHVPKLGKRTPHYLHPHIARITTVNQHGRSPCLKLNTFNSRFLTLSISPRIPDSWSRSAGQPLSLLRSAGELTHISLSALLYRYDLEMLPSKLVYCRRQFQFWQCRDGIPVPPWYLLLPSDSYKLYVECPMTSTGSKDGNRRSGW